MPDKLFPGAPTHLQGWTAWNKAILAPEELCLTRLPEMCDTASSEIHWLEKHVAQI